MGLFHFFRRKKGQKKLDEVAERYESEVLLEDQKKDAAQVKRYLIERCEEMAKEATDMAAAASRPSPSAGAACASSGRRMGYSVFS